MKTVTKNSDDGYPAPVIAEIFRGTSKMSPSESEFRTYGVSYRKRRVINSPRNEADKAMKDVLADMLTEDNGVRIRMMLDLFRRIDAGAFENIVRDLCGDGMSEARKTFLYYSVLFRNEPHVRMLFNRAELPMFFIASVVMYTASRSCGLTDRNDSALDEVLEMIPKETLFQLMISSDTISQDKKLVIHVLSKMDNRYLDRYFEDMGRVRDFITAVSVLPKEMAKGFFFRNPQLHGYFKFLLNAVDASTVPNIAELCRIDLTEVSEIKKIAEYLSGKFNLSKEKGLPLSLRDKSRYATIVSSVRHLENVAHVLSGLENEGAISGEEKNLIEEILGNPIFRDVLEKYSARKMPEKRGVEFMW